MKGLSAKVTSKGQITIPKDIRDHLGLELDSTVNFIILPNGKVMIENQRRGELLDQALNHPMVENFISTFFEGKLRASMYIGALIQAGLLTNEILETMDNVAIIEQLIGNLRSNNGD
ncbi:AbrB/MazE/SpoVT family DNA-binding domain-containing protein [Paenibacillus sp. IITD108]|uniref:AbrB/MazE/SpoVT family DNA-binding domain-containing protein n=1 Tax=Paenibacillus sp. IITD108 TaxID=3116649 RepID=UPI002F4263CA